VVASGLGAYDLQVYPIAVLHNLATAHTATGVVVQFTVQLRGGIYQLSAEPVSLAPGETLADTVLCTDACGGATSTDVLVTVGGWVAENRTVISATSASYACGSPCSGSTGYQGAVSGSLSREVTSGTLVSLSAVCMDGSGAIVGGGFSQALWPPPGPVTVPVLVSTRPASCQLYASEVG
jgi:hypothetical protein